MCIIHIEIYKRETYLAKFLYAKLLYERRIEENVFLSSPRVPGISKVIWQFERPGFKYDFCVCDLIIITMRLSCFEMSSTILLKGSGSTGSSSLA